MITVNATGLGPDSKPFRSEAADDTLAEALHRIAMTLERQFGSDLNGVRLLSFAFEIEKEN